MWPLQSGYSTACPCCALPWPPPVQQVYGPTSTTALFPLPSCAPFYHLPPTIPGQDSLSPCPPYPTPSPGLFPLSRLSTATSNGDQPSQVPPPHTSSKPAGEPTCSPCQSPLTWSGHNPTSLLVTPAYK
jgi:hypothetical protein